MKIANTLFCAAACAVALAAPAAFAQKADKQDAKSLRSLAQANMAEVAAGRLAADKAQSGEVKKFGQHMVDDHSKMLDETKQLAQQKGVQLPASPNKKQQAAAKKLEGLSGDEFDRAFMSMMVKDHGEALQLAQKTSRQAKDADLKAAAQKAAPEIEEHLKMARQLSGETGAKSK